MIYDIFAISPSAWKRRVWFFIATKKRAAHIPIPLSLSLSLVFDHCP